MIEEESCVSFDSQTSSTRRSWSRRFAAIVVIYITVAYVIAPSVWFLIESDHRDQLWRVTTTADGHPGDPINVSLIGDNSDIAHLMKLAGWFQADKLGIRSDIAIAVDTLVDRQYNDAPVSRLFMFGRQEDLAFELPIVANPRHRHHVRLWKSKQVDAAGRAIWFGSASFDRRVGFSHTTGQFTHHIAANVDAERDFLADSARRTGLLSNEKTESNFHQTLSGFNGGGDRWTTDGSLWQATIRDGAVVRDVVRRLP